MFKGKLGMTPYGIIVTKGKMKKIESAIAETYLFSLHIILQIRYNETVLGISFSLNWKPLKSLRLSWQKENEVKIK